MATKVAVTPLIGANLDNTVVSTTALRAAGVMPQARLGDQVFGNDGKRYIYAEAGAAITAATAVCLINVTTFIAAASGGTALSPAVALATGDRAWFSVASV